MTAHKNKDNMIWIDMEMTGLDPEQERIIEVAVLITDSNLEIIAEGPELVIHQPDRLMKKMDEWNQKQHKKSGLIDRVAVSKMTEKKAEKQILDFIKEYCYPKKSLLCGSAVHHDRRFLIKYMPKIHEYLHYRHVDVSSIKDLIRRWYPKDKNMPEKSEQHRALSDIRESIEELRWYKENYFRKPSEIPSTQAG